MNEIKKLLAKSTFSEEDKAKYIALTDSELMLCIKSTCALGCNASSYATTGMLLNSFKFIKLGKILKCTLPWLLISLLTTLAIAINDEIKKGNIGIVNIPEEDVKKTIEKYNQKDPDADKKIREALEKYNQKKANYMKEDLRIEYDKTRKKMMSLIKKRLDLSIFR